MGPVEALQKTGAPYPEYQFLTCGHSLRLHISIVPIWQTRRYVRHNSQATLRLLLAAPAFIHCPSGNNIRMFELACSHQAIHLGLGAPIKFDELLGIAGQ